jgi:hypothetical protein
VPRVELLFFPGCPHIDGARTQLTTALAQVGLPASWTERDDAQGYGSPTILVNGVDVMGALPGHDASCRLYVGTEVPGAPPLAALLSALRNPAGF